MKTVEEALVSRTKTKVSVRGKIIQVYIQTVEEATRLVTVKNEENVKVKNIFLEDSTKTCKIALWRNLADQTIRPGDYVEVSSALQTPSEMRYPYLPRPGQQSLKQSAQKKMLNGR